MLRTRQFPRLSVRVLLRVLPASLPSFVMDGRVTALSGVFGGNFIAAGQGHPITTLRDVTSPPSPRFTS